ncbi:hypothetical protein SHM7688_01828 [Shimia marina]|uniref:Uncharacterized protein n=1 Tax=Shimia marina TaxID=321267 RepID=A0A0P1F9R0_9RHOB|nr:hypothetical protein SHM7688_01828 [Shimia marina]
MTLCQIHHLRDFGFRNFMAEHANDGHTFLVHRKHDFKRLSVGHAKKALQHMHDKLHRSIVIVQQQHLVQRWFFGAHTCFQCDPNVSAVVITHRHLYVPKRHIHKNPVCGLLFI